MHYKTTPLIVTKELVKKVLKSSALGKVFYPLFQKIYKIYATPMKCKRLQNHGVETLRRFEEFMHSEKISHCMEFGTLLGIIRDQGFIKHDDDIDVVIMPGAIQPVVLLKKFMRAGYGFIHGFEYKGKLIEFTLADPSQVTIDIFLPVLNPDDPTRFDYTIPYWNPKTAYPNEEANNVRCTTYLGDAGVHDIEFLGVMVPIASNAEQVLESEYGSWRVPDPNYRPEDHIVVRQLDGFAYRVDLQTSLSLQ